MRQLQESIIKELGVRPTIDPASEFENRSRCLARYLMKSRINGFVLGVSGGQDSLLAGMIAKQATELCRARGRDASLHAMLLPYKTQADRADAEGALKFIKPHFTHDFNIAAATDAFAATYDQMPGDTLSDYHKGNVKARMRMIAQYALAGENGLVVIGTDHAAEAVTGFYTKFGDGAADVVPLAGLDKRQGRQMLTYAGAPSRFITKAPTADLLDDTPSQPDETELGLSYDVIDDYLEGKAIDPALAEKLEARYLATQHKREMPLAFHE